MEACRDASATDVPRIAEMARWFREEIEPIRGGVLWAAHEGRQEPLEAAYDALVRSGETHVVVGTIDDTVVGFGVGETDQLHDGRLLGVISDLYVEPGAREIGVGEAMTDVLIARFEAAGCVGIDAWALPGQRMTKNFFEEHGFVSRRIIVHKPLRG